LRSCPGRDKLWDMLKLSAAASALLACSLPAFAQPFASEFDAARASFSHAGDMDLDRGGSLSVPRFEIRSLLSRPITPAEGILVIPMFQYKFAQLDFDGTPANFPIGDEDLHSLNLSAFLLSSCKGSPWLYGGWVRAEMATDFQHIDGDDFTFDVAAGAGYKLNERFTLGFGGVLLNLNGDTRFFPGVFFDWAATEQIRVGFYGPALVATYEHDDNWLFSLRGDSGGDVWNITDTGGASRSIDLTSYRLGLYASRRLTADLWLTVGAGATFGNEIELTRPKGDRIFKDDMDSGLFGQVSLRVIKW
jgi:hypothetical protein